MRRVLVLTGYVLGGLVAIGLAAWLLTGGWQQVNAWLPPGLRKIIGEPSINKVVPQQADPSGAPWEQRPGAGGDDEEAAPDLPKGKRAAGTDPDENAEEGATPDENAIEPAVKPGALDEEEAAAATLAPIRALDEAAGAAIAAYEKSPDDQGKYHAAEQAVEALKSVAIGDNTTLALRSAAVEFRNERANERAEALAAARRVGRATHKVYGTAALDEPFLALREAASGTSPLVAELYDGTLVRVHLDTGTGWFRVEAITGPAAGKSGYARGKGLQKLPRPR